jgi:hypothetical protein
MKQTASRVVLVHVLNDSSPQQLIAVSVKFQKSLESSFTLPRAQRMRWRLVLVKEVNHIMWD